MTIPNPLSEKTTAEIEALARKISVAEELDGEIRAELRGHIEDKVRGYVSETVKVSEADAMLLAKAHFGDAAVIKEMFEGVHAKAYTGSMVRRAAIAAVAYLFVDNVVKNFITSIWDHVEFARANAGRILPENATTVYSSSWFVSLAYFFVVKAAVLLVTWAILRGWKRSAAAMMRLRPWSLGIMVILYVLLLMLEYYPAVSRFLDPITNSPFVRPAWEPAVRVLMATVFLCVSAGIWIGWCEHGVRTMRAVVWGAASWLVYKLLVEQVGETISYSLVRSPHMGFWEMAKFYGGMLLWFPDLILLQLGVVVVVGAMFMVWRRKRQIVVV